VSRKFKKKAPLNKKTFLDDRTGLRFYIIIPRRIVHEKIKKPAPAG
jgi:hypothetical protein